MRTTILLADDDPITQSLLNGYLEEWGFEVTCADSGQHALEHICRRSFSLFLLDLYMDDMSGLDVLHEIRQTPRLAERPVLMVSAEQHPASMEVALQFGANDYLTKPIDAHWLRAKLRRHLPKVAAEPLAPGSRLGRYEIKSLLADDQVYLAEDLRLRRPVRLKVAPEAEAMALARVSHPQVLAVYDVGSEPVSFFVGEYSEGEPLRRADAERAKSWTLQILDGLEALHQAGVVVANLSPSSLQLTGAGRVKLMDLSEAVTSDFGDGIASHTAAAYAAPEQVDPLFGPIGTRADLFSVAGILHFLLTGSAPFTPELPHQQLLAQAFANPGPLGQDVPVGLREICRQGLEKEQSQRFQTVEEFRRALIALK